MAAKRQPARVPAEGSYGATLRAARHAAGLSLDAVARELGIPLQCVNGAELGGRQLARHHFPTLLRLMPTLTEATLVQFWWAYHLERHGVPADEAGAVLGAIARLKGQRHA